MEVTEGGLISYEIGKEIRVEIGASGTVHRVKYQLDEDDTQIVSGGSITVKIHEPARKQLSLYFGFSEPQGGLYEVRVHDSSGDFQSHTVEQLPGQNAVILAFGLEGNDGETIPRTPPQRPI
jgi:hypothetical protein